jgi:hypothetical protein
MNARMLSTWVLTLGAWAGPALAWPGTACKFTAERHSEIDVAGAHSIVIHAGAGDLKIQGRNAGAKVSVRGKACASRQELLEQTLVKVERDGDVIRVSTQIPGDKAGASNLWGANSPYLDLDVDLPAELPISLVDSSGDVVISHVAGGSIRDSSGDLQVADVGGDLDVLDSSGDIGIGDVRGKLTLEDSSGDMKLRNIRGDINVKADSSGDISVTDAGANVTIDSDGSGDVEVEGAAGNFTLGRKGSGDVHVHAVRGTTSIPDYKKD